MSLVKASKVSLTVLEIASDRSREDTQVQFNSQCNRQQFTSVKSRLYYNAIILVTVVLKHHQRHSSAMNLPKQKFHLK